MVRGPDEAAPVPDPFLPRRPLPAGLVRPVRIDPTGQAGPTRAQSRSRRWRRVGHNAYVPVTAEAPPEQRILDAVAHLPEHGAVSGWAALRLWEAREKLPARVGYGLMALCGFGAAIMPVSGFWTGIVPALLIVRRARQA